MRSILYVTNLYVSLFFGVETGAHEMTDQNKTPTETQGKAGRIVTYIGLATGIVLALIPFTEAGAKLIVTIKHSACVIGLDFDWCESQVSDDLNEEQKRRIKDALKALEGANSK